MVKYFLKISINVPSESFETGYSFSERSIGIELRSGCWGTLVPLPPGSDLFYVTIGLEEISWYKSGQHLFCFGVKKWEKWCLGVVMGKESFVCFSFLSFLWDKPKQSERRKVRRGGMFKWQLKEERFIKRLGIRWVWTAEFYELIQKNAFAISMQRNPEGCAWWRLPFISQTSLMIILRGRLRISKLDPRPVFFHLEYFSHLTLAYALKIPSGWNFREVEKNG